MQYKVNEPVFTSILDDVGSLQPRAGSLYIQGTSVEDRSYHTETWGPGYSTTEFVSLVEEDESSVSFSLRGEDVKIRLRSLSEIRKFLADETYSSIYLDITGLPHHVWAPLLRAIRERSEPAWCVYVEPVDYRFSSTPTEGTIFDLSERIQGIRPLPGFASLTSVASREELFVPLLGFEGARLAFMLESVQPRRSDICPVIGVPGFRPEYPFFSYLGNRLQLEDTKAWQNVRFAPANCPFSLYHVLEQLSQSAVGQYLKIALIGTKPHALGAVLYHLDHPGGSEILYDYPVRKAKRTVGVSRACVYDLSLLPPIRPDRRTADG